MMVVYPGHLKVSRANRGSIDYLVRLERYSLIRYTACATYETDYGAGKKEVFAD